MHLAEGLPWTTLVQREFKCRGHINVLEAKNLAILFRHVPCDTKFGVGLYSKVVLGAFARGRSCSTKLNNVLRRAAP